MQRMHMPNGCSRENRHRVDCGVGKIMLRCDSSLKNGLIEVEVPSSVINLYVLENASKCCVWFYKFLFFSSVKYQLKIITFNFKLIKHFSFLNRSDKYA